MQRDEGIIGDPDSLDLQIIYIWIKSFVKISNQEIKLGGAYELSFDQDSKTLTIAANKNHIENLFTKANANANITNVSAIAGKNGAGKSSILKYMLSQYLDNSSGVDAECILAIMANGRLKLYINLPFEITINSEIKIPPVDLISVKPEVKALKSTARVIQQRNMRINVFDSIHTSFVYINPAFELKPQIDGNLNKCDLSTNHFIQNDFGRLSSVENVNEDEEAEFNKLIAKHRNLISALDTENDISSQKELLTTSLNQIFHSFEYFRSQRLERHAFAEIERIVKLISDHHNTDLYTVIKDHATIPELLTIKLQRNWVQKFDINPVAKNKEVDTAAELLQSIGTQFYLKHFSDPESGQWKKRLIIETLLMLISLDSRNSGGQLSVIANFKSKMANIDNLDNLISSLINAYCEFIFLKPASLKDDIELYLSSIDKLEPCFTFGDDNIGYSEYNIRMKNPEGVSEFLRAYRKLARLHGVFYFNWHAVSAGEQNRLSLFARLHTLADNEREPSLKRNVFLLVDEGDLGYHPEWKRTFIDSLLTFVSKDWEPKNFNNGFFVPTKRNVQVILTTNEPFLLSDIPSYNVTILGEDRSGMRSFECFGANINELYTRGFFIDSLIGEFAKKTILDGFKLVRKKSLSKIAATHISKLSQIIGEPIISQALIREIAGMTKPKHRLRNKPNA